MDFDLNNATQVQLLNNDYNELVYLARTTQPITFLTWFSFGAVITEHLTALGMEWQLLKERPFKGINLVYFGLRYFGLLAILCFVLLNTLGHSSGCSISIRSFAALSTTVDVMVQLVFLIRIRALMTTSALRQYLSIFYVVLMLVQLGLAIRSIIGITAQSAPSGANGCLPILRDDLVAIPKLLNSMFDLAIFINTCILINRAPSLTPTMQKVYRIMIRDNIIYVGVVTTASVLQAILVFTNLPDLYRLMLFPVILGTVIIFGCRVFLRLRFMHASMPHLDIEQEQTSKQFEEWVRKASEQWPAILVSPALSSQSVARTLSRSVSPLPDQLRIQSHQRTPSDTTLIPEEVSNPKNHFVY